MEKFEGGKTLKMKRIYMVTIEEIDQTSIAIDSNIYNDEILECKPTEEIKKGQKKHSFKVLQTIFRKFFDFTVFLAEFICKIPIIGFVILIVWNATNFLCNKFYKAAIYSTIAAYILFIVHQTVHLNSDCALFSGLFSFFLTIFLLQYFSKYGNQIFWLLFSLLLAGASFLFLKNNLPYEINVDILRCFSYKNFGNTLTTMSVIISVSSVLIKDRQPMKI